MPRRYRCKKCGLDHPPPTGKHCPQANEQSNGAANSTDMLNVLLDIKEKVEDIEQRVKVVEEAEADSPRKGINVLNDSQPDEFEVRGAEGGVQDLTTPDTLRRDLRLMAQATERMAQLRDSDDEIEGNDTANGRRNGKKSGSLLMASDVVKKRIDWPHLYVRRVVGGKRKSVAYADLKVEEFVFGFLSMIESPKCKWNYRTMTRLLRMIMQDTIDFSWANGLGFYETLGLEVEYGDLDWENVELIRDMRMTYSRAIFPEKPENKTTNKAQGKTSTTARCCALYQRHACEQSKDHHPFAHACAYCQRTASMFCRHPEEDCYRKMGDEAKNAKKRE